MQTKDLFYGFFFAKSLNQQYLHYNEEAHDCAQNIIVEVFS